MQRYFSAAEQGKVDVLERLLDSMASSNQEMKAEGKANVAQILAGAETGQFSGTFGKTPLHKVKVTKVSFQWKNNL